MAVWDGKPGDGPGGVASVVEHWRSSGLAIDLIDSLRPAEQTGQGPRVSDSETPSAECAEHGEASYRLRAMLFADAVGYSKLSEDQIPVFVDQFLAPIGRLIEESGASPILKESAGDGLYFVFESVARSGQSSALALRDLIAGVDWEARGLPASMALRIALHCGPVHTILDPITGRRKYTGPHTSRAARIEPITPPGQVYASQAFRALLGAGREQRRLRCDALGQEQDLIAPGPGRLVVVDRRRRVRVTSPGDQRVIVAAALLGDPQVGNAFHMEDGLRRLTPRPGHTLGQHETQPVRGLGLLDRDVVTHRAQSTIAG